MNHDDTTSTKLSLTAAQFDKAVGVFADGTGGVRLLLNDENHGLYEVVVLSIADLVIEYELLKPHVPGAESGGSTTVIS